MTISRNISVMAQGASTAGTLAGGYGGLGASVSPTTAGNVLFTADGSVWSSTAKIVRGTLVTLTTQTAVDFTSIPSWVKRITITLVGASLSGTANILFQLGTGGVPTTSGYLGSSSSASFASTVATINVSTGIPGYLGTATYSLAGSVVFTNPTSNTWVGNGSFGLGGVIGTVTSTGRIALGGVLDMVRITSTNGTDTLDAGSVNILYE